MLLVGPTGTGKTRLAYDFDPRLYVLEQPNSSSGALWWDGYDTHETVLLDDYTGYVSPGTLLRLLDRYPMSGQVKGGHVHLRMKNIIITSNYQPEQWYPEKPTMFYLALRRRFHQIWNCETLECWTREFPLL